MFNTWILLIYLFVAYGYFNVYIKAVKLLVCGAEKLNSTYHLET